MIILFFALIICFIIFETKELKKEGQTKDIKAFLVSMILIAAYGYIYISDNFRPSLASYLLDFLKVKG